jgi:hypothetical protein
MTLIKKIDEVQLLRGKAIPLSDGSCFVHHLTMGEIADIGLVRFYQYLNLFTANDDEISGLDSNITLYEALIMNAHHNLETRGLIEVGLKVFTKEIEPFYDEERQLFVIDFEYDRKLTKESFDEMRECLQIMYRTKEFEDAEKKYGSEAERKMAEKFKKAREKLAKTKEKEGKKNGPTLKDLLVGLATTNYRSFEDIWKMPFFTFYEIFYCSQRKEHYDINIQSLMAGADSKKVKLVHWLDNEEK